MRVSLNGVTCNLRGATCKRIWQRQKEAVRDSEAGLSDVFALTCREKDTKTNVIYHRFLELTVDETTGKAWRVDSTLLVVSAEHPEAFRDVAVERRQLVLL